MNTLTRAELIGRGQAYLERYPYLFSCRFAESAMEVMENPERFTDEVVTWAEKFLGALSQDEEEAADG